MKSPSKKNGKKGKAKNPNKVNQYTLPDPRQALFLSLLLDINSPTYSNFYQSAIAAKYDETYALNIKNLAPKWLSEKLEEIGLEDMVRKAKRNMNQALDIDHVVDAMGPFGPIIDKATNQPFKKISPTLLKIKLDTSEFIAEKLDRKNFGREVNVAMGFQINIQDDIEKFKTA